MSEIGQTLSHFRIVSKIGQGGMGEVYLADDTTLDRKVALKFLPDAFTSDPERMARFEREAKLLASLNHPNIAGIYGLEHADGSRFLVLEYVEGETLQAKLSKGALPLEDALALCRQIAEGLEAAHEKGVIHRDLKPANVMITAEEKVKILDFGLAKAFSDETQSIDSSQSPTLTEAMTRPGVILGTAAYMSPEQAKGKSVDKRADIWAFGCILYECLTGRKAFEGETVTETLAAILRGEPDWNRLPPNIHPRILLLLERCLEKNSKDRYGVISDARVDIQKVLAGPGGVVVKASAAAARSQRNLKQILMWASITIILLIIVGIVVWYLRAPEPPHVMRSDFELPEGQQFTRTNALSVLAISPDGKRFVYATPEGLYLRSLDKLTAELIPGTEGETGNPFFSPDGKWVGYFSIGDQKLKKISIDGAFSSPVPLCDVHLVRGAHWYGDKIVYGQLPGDIMRISDEGGIPESLVKAKGNTLFAPQILPDGKTLIYTACSAGGTDFRVRIQSLISGDSEELFQGAYAQYLPTGHIIYNMPNDNALYAVPFNLDKLEVMTGGKIPVAKGILQKALSTLYAISDSGTLIYLPGLTIYDPINQRTLVWFDHKGNEEQIPAEPMFYKYPNISPDGTKIAVTNYATGIDHHIYMWDLVRKDFMRLTTEGKDNICPVWDPDSKGIVFVSIGHESGDGLYFKAADDSTGQDEKISSPGFIPCCWSRDGKTIVGEEMSPSMSDVNIAMLSMEGDHTKTTLLQKAPLERSPRISPDRRWMAYASNVKDQEEVYVRPFPEVDKRRWQISTSGGTTPLWDPDGRELYYLNGDKVMVASVKTDPIFDIVGKPQTLFQATFIGPTVGEGIPWDIHPKSKKFLMIKPGESTEYCRKIIIVTNWFEELKKLAPAD